LRHWPPGTNSNTVRAAFFFVPETAFVTPAVVVFVHGFRAKMNPRGSHLKNPISRRWALGLCVFAITAGSYAQWSNPADDVPAYHPSAPLSVGKLPHILAGAELTGENFRYPWQIHVYQQAIKISSVLYQLPCNCRCDKALGHTSLRSCYETLHGTECSTCAKEAIFAYHLTKLGRTPAQIRAGIAHRDYENIDLDKQ